MATREKCIFSKKLMNHLVDLGFKVIRSEVNIKDVNMRVFFFEYSDELQAVIDEYVGYLACGIVNVINIFQPDVLCIGGGVSKQGETLLGPVRAIVEQERITKHNDKQTVICAATLGNDAGIIGAAWL